MKNPQKVLPQILVAIVGSWGYFCTGTVRAWSSPGMPSLNRTRTFEMNNSDYNWIASLTLLSAFIGSLLIAFPMYLYGRRKTLIGHYLFYMVGFLLMGFTYYVEHIDMMYVGRFISGLGAGMSVPVSQIYLSECSSPSIRGRLGSLTASALALGILVTYVVGTFVEWYVLSWIFGCLPLVFVVWTVFMPESPNWFLTNGHEEDARKSLQRLRGRRTDVDGELSKMKENLENSSKTTQKRIRLKDLMTGPVLKPFGISLGIMIFQQTSGVSAIIFNTVSIFRKAGSNLDSHYATIIVGFVQLVFTVASGFFVDRFGRRILWLISSFFSAISLAALGIFFYFQKSWGEEEATAKLGWLPLTSLIVFFISYSGGMSNVPFIVMGEMFPSRFRTLLGSISSSFNIGFAFLVVRLFPVLLSVIGEDGTFFFFAACTFVSLIFVYFLLPETKGKTLEEMEKLFTIINNNNNNNNKEAAEVPLPTIPSLLE